MKEWIHCKTTVIFWTTLSIYVLICFTVSYVGVYGVSLDIENYCTVSLFFEQTYL